jgi:hypothetical protein
MAGYENDLLFFYPKFEEEITNETEVKKVYGWISCRTDHDYFTFYRRHYSIRSQFKREYLILVCVGQGS